MEELLGELIDSRLMDGEDLNTTVLGDARRWIDIYCRLIEFHEDLLERIKAPASGKEHREADEQVVLRELTRLQGRLAKWQQRHALLAPIDFDPRAGIVTSSGTLIPLTRRESQLLDFLLQKPGQYFTARALAAKAWKEPHLSSEQVRTYVVRLRCRLAEAQVRCALHTKRSKGYALLLDDLKTDFAQRAAANGLGPE
jgi:DNA-binding response OmpR family regulator